MIYIWLSALLFGLVHPGSKVILSAGLPLELFCFAYIGIRLLVQLPFVIYQKAYKISDLLKIKIVLLLGLVGSLLQLSEFAGIANGQNVSTVTFLVYTHPFWSILISKIFFNQKLGLLGFVKLFLAITGIILVIGMDQLTFSNLKLHWVSLFAGLLIASWVRVSGVARKAGFSTLTTNFYYDFMSFIFLVTYLFISPDHFTTGPLIEYFQTLNNFLLLAGYSVLIGLLPNLLFYKGSAVVDSITAGYVLLLEPIIATAVACFFWGDEVTFTFVIGALFILSANIPDNFFYRSLKKINVAFLIVVFVSLSGSAVAQEQAGEKKIILMEIIPMASSEYTVSSEKKQIEIGADIALEAFFQRNSCNVKIEKYLEIGTEEKLIDKVNSIKNSNVEQVVVGVSRTNFARVAAKVALGSKIKAISIGASASNIADININFITIVNPWQEQYKLVRKVLEENLCKVSETLGVFNSSDYLSNNFLSMYKSAKLGSIVTDRFQNVFNKKYRCIFVGLNFSDASVVLSSLQLSKWKGNVIGLGDWNINSDELINIASRLNKDVSIFVPTGWKSNINKNSSSFARKFEKRAKTLASPIAAYVHDGVILAAESLCKNKDILGSDINSSSMLRKYSGKNASGNLLSEMHVIKLKGSK